MTSLLEFTENSIKTELCQTIEEDIPSGIDRLDEITIKPEPLSANESYGNVIKTEKDDKQIYTCVQCSEFFEYIEQYELHMSLHNQKYIKIKDCPCCKKQYKHMDKYTLHIQGHLEKYYPCTFCNNICFNQNTLRKHILEHKKNGALACPYCGRVFKIQKSLTMHIRVHTNERPYECNTCGNRFKQLSSLRTHMQLIHSKGNPQECKVCLGKFCTKSSLTRHMKLHNTGRTITCKACNENFLNKDLYKKHRMESHIKLSAFFEICPKCNEEFFTYREYYYHTNVHMSNEKIKGKKNKFRHKLNVVADDTELSSNDKTDVCWLCGEVVLSKMFSEHKNKHLLMTSEEISKCLVSKQYPCKRCDSTYSSKKSLLNHIGSHMEKVFACKQQSCTQHLFTYNGLKRHERKFHIVSMEPSKLRICFLCGVDVLRIDYDQHLNDHVQMTDDELLRCKMANEYPCKQCGMIMTSKSFLLRHTMCHMPKMYPCQKCSDSIGTLYSYVGLRAHVRAVHDEFACKHCNKTFKGSRRFKTHHHKNDYTGNQSNNKTFKCAWCSAEFCNAAAITQHYRTHETSDFRCRICDTRYPVAANIKRHMYKVHQQRFGIEDCYRYLVNKADSTEETFICDRCKVRFSTQNALTKHTEIHMEDRYQCKKCKTCFTDFVKYASHKKNNVCVRWMVEALIPEAKDLKCIYCDELFSEYFYIAKHITNHHLKEFYKCKFCNSSHRLDALRSHLMKRHPRRKKYFCVGCNASFFTFRAYLQHRKGCVECPLAYSGRSRRPEQLIENNIVINDDGIQEDIVDIPEKVMVNEFGDVTVSENGDTSTLALSLMDLDCLENIE